MLVLSLLVGGFAALSSVVVLLFGSTNDTDWGLFLLTLGLLLPAALLAGRRLTIALERSGVSAAGVSELTALAAAGLLVVVLAARIAYSLGVSSTALLLPLTVLWAIALVLAVRHEGGRESAGVQPAERVQRAWMVAAALGLGCVLAFLSPELFSPLQLATSLAIAAGLTALHFLSRGLGGRRWVPRLVDAAAVSLVVLAVTDVSGYLEYLRPDAHTYVLGDGTQLTPQYLAFAHRIHEGFWLGPLNDLLHGRAMLVDTSSQYGVGVFYFLAGLFQIAPLGYGALGLFVGFLTALQYALAYGVMRLAGCARTLALPAIAAAVLGLVFGSIGSPADFPSTGGLRFGLPWLIVGAATAWGRWPRQRRPLQMTAIALVGVASIWSFETFAYVGATFVAVAALDAATQEPGRRGQALVRLLLAATTSCVVAHLALALGTRLLAGSWPDWSTYLAFLQLYSVQDFYFHVVPPWSPGMPLLFLHLASGIALAALCIFRRELVLERLPAFLAVTATTGLGIASFSYFVGHSHPNTLIYSGLPAVVEGCIWVSLISDRLPGVSRTVRMGAVAASLWLAALVAISGWPDTTEKWRRTALAHIIPDGGRSGSIRDALPYLWESPPSDARAVEAEELLDRHLPSGTPALVIVEPELSVETLVRSDRVNLLPISHPEQDNIVPDEADPKVLEAIDRLRPGTVMLTQPDLFDAPVKLAGAFAPGQLVRLQKLALDRIRARFRLREIERGASGLAIVRLLPRR